MTTPRVTLATPVHLLVLIGGGEFSFGETREIDQYLLSRVAPDRRRVAFLPTASGSAEYANHFGTYIRGLDPSFETLNVPVYRGRDSRRPRNLAQIREAGLIYLGGGVTNTLLETLRESVAEAAMREAAASGAVVAAIGAAAACFGTLVRDMRGASPLPGLGWLERTAIDVAFDPSNDGNLRRLMASPDIDLGLGLPGGTALAVAGDGTTEIVGPGRIAGVRKGAALAG